MSTPVSKAGAVACRPLCDISVTSDQTHGVLCGAGSNHEANRSVVLRVEDVTGRSQHCDIEALRAEGVTRHPPNECLKCLAEHADWMEMYKDSLTYKPLNGWECSNT